MSGNNKAVPPAGWEPPVILANTDPKFSSDGRMIVEPVVPKPVNEGKVACWVGLLPACPLDSVNAAGLSICKVQYGPRQDRHRPDITIFDVPFAGVVVFLSKREMAKLSESLKSFGIRIERRLRTYAKGSNDPLLVVGKPHGYQQLEQIETMLFSAASPMRPGDLPLSHWVYTQVVNGAFARPDHERMDGAEYPAPLTAWNPELEARLPARYWPSSPAVEVTDSDFDSGEADVAAIQQQREADVAALARERARVERARTGRRGPGRPKKPATVPVAEVAAPVAVEPTPGGAA